MVVINATTTAWGTLGVKGHIPMGQADQSTLWETSYALHTPKDTKCVPRYVKHVHLCLYQQMWV